ncbi:MAG: hypothetical protein WHS46_10950, partial [Desulfosoma sp.]
YDTCDMILLCTDTISRIKAIVKRSHSSGDMLFNKTSLERDVFFGLSHDVSKTTFVLFHSGLSLSLSDLQLISTNDIDVQIRQRKAILWEGRLHAGQPVRLRLDGLFFDSEAFDLLSKQMKRYALLDLVTAAVGQDPRPPVSMPILQFARNYVPFAHYDSFIPTANLTDAGVEFLQGWSHFEKWGVWSEDNFATLLIHTGEGSKAYEVTFRLHGYSPPENPVRMLRLTVNGRPLGALRLSGGVGPSDYRFMFRTRPDEKFINFGFEIENPVSPAELGRGSDPRRLGVGLSGFKLRKLAETVK